MCGVEPTKLQGRLASKTRYGDGNLSSATNFPERKEI